MNLALFHNLPSGGGAFRVLAEYVAHSPHHDFTLYTRRVETDGLLKLDPRVAVRARPLPPASSPLGRMRVLWGLPGLGRRLAAEIDAAGHDAVFCQASDLTQAPEVLPWLATPTLYYAPEALRIAYESVPDLAPRRHSVRERLADAGLNPYERRRKALDRRHIRAAHRVMTHSRFTARRLQEIYGVHSEIVPLGVDAASFTPAGASRERYVLSVGALQALKGHQFVIEALARLPEPRPRLVIVGDRGEFEDALRALAPERGVELEVRRAVPFAELVDLYRRAGALACGQIDEPFGLVPLEAMATATPVVAVAEGGFLETVDDGRTGLLAPRDPEAFAAGLARVLEDRELAQRLGRTGREEVERRWTWETTARGIDRLLERLITERRR